MKREIKASTSSRNTRIINKIRDIDDETFNSLSAGERRILSKCANSKDPICFLDGVDAAWNAPLSDKFGELINSLFE